MGTVAATAHPGPSCRRTRAAAASAAQTLSTPSRAALYSEIQATAAADAFLAPLYCSPYAYASSTKVRGFLVTPLGNYHLEDVWTST